MNKPTWIAVLAAVFAFSGGCGRSPKTDGSQTASNPDAAAPEAGAEPPKDRRLGLFDDFEGEKVAPFWLPGDYGSGLHVPGAVETSTDYARTGRKSVKMTVREGDVAQPGGDGTTTERAELDSGYLPLLNRDVWYGFSFLIPPDFPIVENRLVISSCKQRNIAAPMTAQRFVNGRHYFTIWESGPGNGRGRHYALPKIKTGVWMDMVFHVRFSTGGEGRVEIWADGRKVLSRKGPLADPSGENQFYHKIGLYRDRWKQPMTIYYDNYALGESMEEVNPARFDKRP